MNLHISQTLSLANQIRQSLLNVAFNAPVDGVHLGSSLSLVDMATVLYGSKMRYRADAMDDAQRDVFILSKGHAALGLYAVLHAVGIITRDQLNSFDVNGSRFQALAPMYPSAGIDFPGGSLGQGLSYGVGMSIGHRLKQQPWHTWVVMGDGECNEGSVWEAAFFAAQQQLEALTVIIDANGMQSDGANRDILPLDHQALWRACGWQVVECDGHDHQALMTAFDHPHEGKPKAIIANTVKGKGISFMENNNDFHRSKLTKDQLQLALAELAGGAL